MVNDLRWCMIIIFPSLGIKPIFVVRSRPVIYNIKNFLTSRIYKLKILFTHTVKFTIYIHVITINNNYYLKDIRYNIYNFKIKSSTESRTHLYISLISFFKINGLITQSPCLFCFFFFTIFIIFFIQYHFC